MVMMGIEFAGDIPFSDVYVHSVIQAPDGRRMSKSLGTGIDPLDEIERHGADALRFGLMAMSSSQDVRYSTAKVEQGRDLSNKLWNASRLVLLNAADVDPGPRAVRVEDRWILSRLERTVELVTTSIDDNDFAHAVLELYRFIWSELCDWYLETVKPRLYDGEEEASAVLLFVLERVLALAHPFIPFVTEEIWGYLPGERTPLVVSPFPVAQPERIDAEAEAEIGGAIELTRSLRRWRDLAGVEARAVLSARVRAEPHEMVGRLARFEFTHDGTGAEVVTSVGSVEVLASDQLDAARVAERVEERRAQLRSEVERGERKLANEGFVAKAPPEVVEAEREKLEGYRAELAELGD
jgi:valyl-tRNA synthetase